ncbi:ABC transporter ATP-binding protein, partial [Klebsiella pneumoniae]|nr:ABC transporter ATP-binding protein [Klebsiella pneumoniae]
FYRPQRGRVLFDGRDVTRIAPDRRAAQGLGRTFQNVALFEGMTVLDNVKLGAHARLRSGILATMAGTPAARREELRLREEV